MRVSKFIPAIAVAALVLGAGSVRAEEKLLNVYNWSDYIAEDTIQKFEAATGIKVNYDVFDSNEILEAKLLTGSTGYDVVVPTANFLERQIKAGVFAKLDKSKLPNLKNMDPVIAARVALHDPENAHSVTYMWGTTGFGYNVKAIKQRLGDMPTNTWDLFFDPAVVSKLADCGVSLLDAPTDVVQTALNYLGLDPNSESADDLAKAEELLAKIRPHLRYFHSSQYIEDLANGETCLAMGYSGDILQAADRATEANQGVEIQYVIPKEGAVIWFDMLAIPADAPHPENAHAFINFIMEPQIAADISNYVLYANANAASMPMVDDDVKNNPSVYPTEDVKKNLFPMLARSAKYDRLLKRSWTRLKAGQ
ncbi:MAG: polyamine ABC transporter substrate-binding protein [Nisaea sp.]|uniref:polyamine ABC transporter substrate-binding protein n=1 Tax=Nisaea sp. TaxID=2024842 RepID=UPI001B10DA43|nr:polyamine ABC transporter substrate-binding protein [Nisaea sp.]MBO6562709.1 polyamine ABC transporter substrate-binding protein [Nisaea sp.]